MREPTVYINGEPVCARPPNKIGEYAELGNVTSKQLEEDEAEFVRVCEGQMKANDDKVKVVDVNIAESKLSYEIMDDAAQVFLKSKIMDNIHKYFYMIAFTGYIREMAAMAISTATDEDKAKHGLAGGKISTPGDQLKLAKTFVAWMEEHAKLRTIVEEGKGKLQWERYIPASALGNLESLASSDFKANLGKIIPDIYQTAHSMFSDMPQGDHKKRAKYRFASKTLMRILPAPVKEEIEGLIEKKTISLDLYEILGKCTWNPGT